jgi:hypothetical protein
MTDSLFLKVTDYWLKPRTWYAYTDLAIDGYRTIATKEDQRQAGAWEIAPRPAKRVRQFGLSPLTPYRDYYGQFRLETKLLPEQLEVKFAIGYANHTKLATVDDYANFSWLRLCTGIDQMLYPNLAQQKQLLEYLLTHSSRPRLLITRVYQYLQFDLYQELTNRIMAQQSGIIAKMSLISDNDRQ